MPAGYFDTTKGIYQQAFPIDNAATLLGDEYRFYKNIRKMTWAPQTGARGATTKGLVWEYEVYPEAQNNLNQYAEGSDAAPIEHFNKMKMGNNFTISKKSYGLTGTAIAQGGIEGLDFQRKLSFHAFCKDINKILVRSTNAVEGTTAVAGQSKGIYGFFSASNEVDANNERITPDLLEEIGIMSSQKGVTYTAIYCNPVQKKLINALYGNIFRTEVGKTTYHGTDIKTISNITGFNRPLTIYVDNEFQVNDIVFVAENDISCVTLREEANEDISVKGKDAKSFQFLKEFTLKIDHPLAVARIKNLARQ